MNNQSTYLRLPNELHLIIADSLPLADRCLLRKTCRHLRKVIPNPINTRNHVLDLVYSGPFFQPTPFALEHNLLACTECERIRTLERFPCSVMLGKEFPRLECGSIDESMLNRCWTSKKCVDCMISSERMCGNMRGRWIWLGTKRYVFCNDCTRLGLLDPAEVEETWGMCQQRNLKCWECSSSTAVERLQVG